MGINVIVTRSADEMSRKAAELFAQKISSEPNMALGLATGGTPEKMYAELPRLHLAEGLDFARATTYNLDEYLGLDGNHSQSYRHFMDKKIFERINIDRAATHVLNGIAEDPEQECRDYEQAIRKSGGIGLQLLGIGGNGHIAFNEPGSRADSRTRVVGLNPDTIQANARFFNNMDEAPVKALSMGIATIMEAEEIILIASGANKAEAVLRAIEGPVCEDVPASLLQKHPRCTFILDMEAAGRLRKKGSQLCAE